MQACFFYAADSIAAKLPAYLEPMLRDAPMKQVRLATRTTSMRVEAIVVTDTVSAIAKSVTCCKSIPARR
jgi:hypothetical protein